MKNEIILIGMNNYIPKSKIEGFFEPSSRPIKSIISNKRKEDRLINATGGRKTRCVILLNNGYLILSATSPKSLAQRYIE